MSSGRDQAHENRRNFHLCLWNGALTSMGSAFFPYETVMAGLAFQLTGSTVLVGLMTAVANIGWRWPQIFVGSRVEHLERKMPSYNLTTYIRLAAICGMGASIWLWQSQPMALYWFLLLFTTIFSSGGGMCVVPFVDVMAKVIPSGRLPMLLAWRNFAGGLLGVVAGGIAAFLLSTKQSGLAFPTNYSVLFALAFIVNFAGYTMFSVIREPLQRVVTNRVPFSTFFRGGVEVFRTNRNYSRYFLYRTAFAFGMMSQALFVPYAMVHFGAPAYRTGLFSAAVALSGAFASILLGRLAGRFGELALLRVCAAMLLLGPGLAVLLTVLEQVPLTGDWIRAHYMWPFFLLFGAQTGAVTGSDIGNTLYLLAVSPAERRPTYISFMNTLSAPLTLTPVFAGWLAPRAGYQATFIVSMVFALLALAISWRIGKPQIGEQPDGESLPPS